MSKPGPALPSLPGFSAAAVLLCLLGAVALLAPAPVAAADFKPLSTPPATLGELQAHRHVPGISPDAAFSAAELERDSEAGLYRQVSRNFKFGLRYARAVFSLAPAEAEAPEDDHYVFLNLVGML